MTPQQIRAELSDLGPDAILFDGMDAALIGVGYISGVGPVAVYSRTKMYDKMLADGLSSDEADEYYMGRFVALRAGEFTPVIVDDLQ